MTGLKPDTSYVFRVRAQNVAGVGKPSAALGPVLAHTRPGEWRSWTHFFTTLALNSIICHPHNYNTTSWANFFKSRLCTFALQLFTLPFSGTKEIYVDVDDDGVISLVFECSEMTEGSEFIWSKNYQTITDTSDLTIVNEHGKWVSFMCPFFLVESSLCLCSRLVSKLC